MLTFGSYFYLLERTDTGTVSLITTAIKTYMRNIRDGVELFITSELSRDDLLSRFTTVDVDGAKVSLNISRSTSTVGGEYIPKLKVIRLKNTDLYDKTKLLLTYISQAPNADKIDVDRLRSLTMAFLQAIYNASGDLSHELVHFLDDVKIRSKNKNERTLGDVISPKAPTTPKNNSWTDYVNQTWEVNADLLKYLFKNPKIKTVKDFLKLVNTNLDSIVWLSQLSPKNKRKVMTRIYQYFNQHVK